jgi:hypothetical protein
MRRGRVGETAHRDDVGAECDRPLEQRFVAVHPGEVRRLDEQVVVQTGVEDQVDVVAVRLEHRHHVAHAEILDAPVVEENAHESPRSLMG